VVQIPKKGDAHEVTNYRPVSLLSQVSKVLERLIFRQVSSFIKDSLYDIQHGFRCNRSCVTQLLNVFHDLGRALDSGNEIDLLYLDFAKAFDSVSRSKLLFKLNLLEFPVNFLTGSLIISIIGNSVSLSKEFLHLSLTLNLVCRKVVS
jgi:hypothetical protein